MSQSSTGSNTVLQDGALLVARILIVGVFLVAGYWKLTGIAFFVTFFGAIGVPMPTIAAYATMVAEIALPLLIILGYQARLAALALIGLTVIATLLAHRYWEVPPAQQFGQAMNFWRNVGLVGGLLLIAAFGPGRFALRR
jgi:putative oxidoreductase